jgi:hypothetical protein
MKTISTLFLSLFAGVALMAAGVRPSSTITIRSAERGDLRVVVDGRRFEPNQNFLRLRGISSGNHSIKVYREMTSGRHSIFGKRYELVFNRTMRLRNSSNVMISIDRYGRASVRESRSNERFDRDRDRDGRYEDDRDFRDRDFRDRDFNDRDWNKSNDFDFESGRNSGDYDVYDEDNYGYNSDRAMSDHEFSTVLQSMQREWLETNKQKSASHIISSNYLTTSQVRQMLQLFSFENIKLELAKQAYAKTVDQRNYFSINDVFSFNSSRDELARYIRSYRG